MARRTEVITIDTPAVAARPAEVDESGNVIFPAVTAKPAGRDHGKTFVLTEMSAAAAEAWAIKALLALARAGVEIPDETTGMAGLAVAGLKALQSLDYAAVKPLLDEMFTCVQYQHRPGHPPQEADPNIEEVGTRLTLRKALFRLHTGF